MLGYFVAFDAQMDSPSTTGIYINLYKYLHKSLQISTKIPTSIYTNSAIVPLSTS